MKVKTAELSGRALDWAVGKSIGTNIGVTIGGLVKEIVSHNPIEMSLWQPTNDWSICGPLIAQYGVWLSDKDGAFTASCKPHFDIAIYDAETPQIAICRAVVASKLGDEVDIPDELMEVGE